MTVEYDISLNFRGNDALKQVDNIQTKVNQVDQSAQRLTTSMSKVGLAIKAALGSAALAQVIKYADEWKALENKLIDVVGAGDQAGDTLVELNKIAVSSAQNIGDVVEGYSAIADSLNDLGFSQKEQISVAASLQNSLLASGNSAQQNASLINAYSKAINNGKLQGEEFNRIVELGGPLLRALKNEMADVTGVAKLTTEELKALTTAGDVKAINLANALKNAREEMERLAGQVQLTVSQSYTQLTNAFTQQIGLMDKAAGGTRALANTFSFLAENMDTVFTVAEAIAVLFSGRMAASIGAYAASILASNRATKALTTSVSGLSGVVLQNGLAIDKQSGSVIFGRREADKAVIAQHGLAKAYQQSAISAQAANVAVDKYGASVGVYGKTTENARRKTDLLGKAMGVVSRTASGLYALLGGLPGILITAGFAIALYGDKLIGLGDVSDIASVRTESLRANIEKQEKAIISVTKEMNNLIKAGKGSSDEFKTLENTMKSLREVGVLLNKELDETANDLPANLKAAEQQVVELEQALERVAQQQAIARQTAQFTGDNTQQISLLQQEGQITEQLEKRRQEVVELTKLIEEQGDERVAIVNTTNKKLDDSYAKFYESIFTRLKQTADQIAVYDNKLIPDVDASAYERALIDIENTNAQAQASIQAQLTATVDTTIKAFDQQIKAQFEASDKLLKGVKKGSVDEQKIIEDRTAKIAKIEQDKADAIALINDTAHSRRLQQERQHTADLAQIEHDRANEILQLREQLAQRSLDNQAVTRQSGIDTRRTDAQVGQFEDTQQGGILNSLITSLGGPDTTVFDQFDQQQSDQSTGEDEALLRQEEKHRAELEQLQTFYDEKATIFADNEAILAELEDQRREDIETATAAHEQAKVDIEREGAEQRQAILNAERQAKIGLWTNLAESSLQILLKNSKKAAKVEKAFSIVRAGMAIVSGTAQALNNPYPANLAFAASVAAQGAALISKLRSFNENGGGGASTPTINTSTPNTSVSSTPGQQETPGQQTIIIQNEVGDNDIISGRVYNQLVDQLITQIEDGGNIGRIIKGDTI